MSLGTVHIPDWARNVLSGAIITDNALDLGVELDNVQFQTMHKIILAMGGSWNRQFAKFTFPPKADAESLIRHALLGQEQPPAPPPNPEGRWDTPPELAHEIIQQARIVPGVTVLDFYAGSGHLTGLVIASGAKVYAVEPDEDCVAYLAERMKGLRKLWHMRPEKWLPDMLYLTGDRFDEAGNLLPKLRFDAIIMHSPHAGMEDLGVTWALWPFVAPGGSLVSVISAENWGGDHNRSVNFRIWCDEIAADVIPIADRMYHDYGELNNANLFVGNKPGEEVDG